MSKYWQFRRVIKKTGCLPGGGEKSTNTFVTTHRCDDNRDMCSDSRRTPWESTPAFLPAVVDIYPVVTLFFHPIIFFDQKNTYKQRADELALLYCSVGFLLPAILTRRVTLWRRAWATAASSVSVSTLPAVYDYLCLILADGFDHYSWTRSRSIFDALEKS
jgi:hypothetical protein